MGKTSLFSNGPVTVEKDLMDEMYDEPGFCNEKGQWQMVFGVVTHPGYQYQGFANRLMETFLEHAKQEGRKGVVLTARRQKSLYMSSLASRTKGSHRPYMAVFHGIK